MRAEMHEAASKGARSAFRRRDVGRAAAATCIRTVSERLPHKTSHGDAFPVWRQSRSRFGPGLGNVTPSDPSHEH